MSHARTSSQNSKLLSQFIAVLASGHYPSINAFWIANQSTLTPFIADLPHKEQLVILKKILAKNGTALIIKKYIETINSIEVLEYGLTLLRNNSHHANLKKETLSLRINALLQEQVVTEKPLTPYAWMSSLNKALWKNDPKEISTLWNECSPEWKDFFCGKEVMINNIKYQISLARCLDNFTVALNQTGTLTEPVQAIWDEKRIELSKYIASLKFQEQVKSLDAVSHITPTPENFLFIIQYVESVNNPAVLRESSAHQTNVAIKLILDLKHSILMGKTLFPEQTPSKEPIVSTKKRARTEKQSHTKKSKTTQPKKNKNTNPQKTSEENDLSDIYGFTPGLSTTEMPDIFTPIPLDEDLDNDSLLYPLPKNTAQQIAKFGICHTQPLQPNSDHTDIESLSPLKRIEFKR